jgi:hypothetical protein
MRRPIFYSSAGFAWYVFLRHAFRATCFLAKDLDFKRHINGVADSLSGESAIFLRPSNGFCDWIDFLIFQKVGSGSHFTILPPQSLFFFGMGLHVEIFNRRKTKANEFAKSRDGHGI